ncbi:MAG: hypothetical protein KIH63_000210 [Candidatus Saccharibacteria bacterium]|nr:hypothetical protein [Candidatus Saccharibacteria bacterium]
MASGPFHTKADMIKATPVEGLTSDQLPVAAAIVVGDIMAVTDMRGMGAPETGILDPSVVRVLEVVANYPERHAAAAARAEYLGYPWTQIARDRNDQVMTAYVADIADQPRSATSQVAIPPMDLGHRPDFVHTMGEDARRLIDTDMSERYETLASLVANRIIERLPCTGAYRQDVVNLAGELVSEQLLGYEVGVQRGLDMADFERRRQLEVLQAAIEPQGGVY